MLGRATQRKPIMRVGSPDRAIDSLLSWILVCNMRNGPSNRRLQSYVRLVAAQFPTAAHRAHQLELWTAIRGAHGFPPSFPDWWRAVR